MPWKEIPNEGHAQLIVEVAVMILTEANDVSRFPRTKNLVDNLPVTLLGMAGRRPRRRKEGDKG